MRDKNGNTVELGNTIRFDEDHFGVGRERTVVTRFDGELGFEAYPNKSKEVIGLKHWQDEFEIVS
ncbi:hypothetical protein P4493_05730 [Bacillus thuringiensis]|jgi:hypothetical protein|uniref:YopX protein domain-containing protein n=3 Tax=Bacillus thuringiensis TaxID=1428 RepID=A0A0B5NPK0_BACTU|nr:MULTISPECIES: hypothetical protein [Bacillus]MEC2537075.1 hypothetical protein [Bacillus cereus]MED1153958.1 hypothetical protein [Bacillus paranthracis]OUB09203.1 hypothetical protein BK708_32215 [Bacillus thuringiensis serovar yunnanensis]AFQ29830.1 hypothetical protein BTF1_28647 [Bacillus thuringiensis HD-789]AJG74048.1 hypothetical protein BF38_6074 [Bacillus thuringiensis]